MKKLLFGAVLLTAMFAACKKEANIIDNNDPKSLNAYAKTTISGIDTIGGVVASGDTLKLKSDTLYILNSKLYVASGGVLMIEAGTRIEGVKKLTTEQSVAIVITRGGKIYATGTANKPIIMTANTYPNAQPGDWGGVVILGYGPTNRTSEVAIEGIGLPTLPPGINVNYGGTGPGANNPIDNSGIFQYVRIEYAGAIISPDNELNGLTCGAVGGFTTINHVMTIYGADDGFEFFGGNFNTDHLVSYGNNDDLFDFDFGYSGRIQFALGYIATGIPYSANPNGIESDNDGTGTAATPRTEPKISNMTIVGAKTKAIALSLGLDFGNLWRRNSSFKLRNSVFIGYDTVLNFNSAGSIADAQIATSNPQTPAKNIRIGYNVLGAFTAPFIGPTVLKNTNKQYIVTDAAVYGTTATQTFFVDAFPSAPNALITGMVPKAGFIKSGANFGDPYNIGFQVVPFKGAVGVGADNWLVENWVDFTP